MNKLQFKQHLENEFPDITIKETERYASVKFKNKCLMEIHKGMYTYRIAINKKFIPEKSRLFNLLYENKSRSSNDVYVKVTNNYVNDCLAFSLDDYVENFISNNL